MRPNYEAKAREFLEARGVLYPLDGEIVALAKLLAEVGAGDAADLRLRAAVANWARATVELLRAARAAYLPLSSDVRPGPAPDPSGLDAVASKIAKGNRHDDGP